jgi:predicted HNH restriction endonuclease
MSGTTGRKTGSISNRRKEMGEEKWAEYQKERLRLKSKRNYLNNMHTYTHWRGNIKRKLIAYKGGRCEKCGYSKDYISVFCFHHKDPKQKDFGIAGCKQRYEKMIKEVDKCILLCHNCHNELHEQENISKRRNYYEEREKIKLGGRGW